MNDTVQSVIDTEIALLQRLTRQPVPPLGYGVDLVCVDDLTPQMRETNPNSVESISQDLYHRMTTFRGGVGDDDDYGIDIVGMLHVGATAKVLRGVAGQIANELRKEDRVTDIAVTVAPDSTGEAWTIKVAVTPLDPLLQPFTLIVAVSDGAALLKETLL